MSPRKFLPLLLLVAGTLSLPIASPVLADQSSQTGGGGSAGGASESVPIRTQTIGGTIRGYHDGRSVRAAPAPQPLPILKQPSAIAQSASELTIIVDPYGNVFTGTSRAGADRTVFRLNLQRISMQTGKPLEAAPGKPLPKLQVRHYSVALAGTNGEFAVIADNHGNVYSGAIRPPVDIAPLAQAVRLQGGRNCTKVDCE